MKIGKLEVHLLSDGVFKLDGGALFGQVPKVLWERLMKPDRKNRVRLGMNCLLIRSPDGNILVDTGAGNKHDDQTREIFGLSTSKLARNLRDVGVAPKEVSCVVLSHLHFDHAGGGTKANRRGAIIPTFPKAQYFIQQAAWDDAVDPTDRGRLCMRQRRDPEDHSDKYAVRVRRAPDRRRVERWATLQNMRPGRQYPLPIMGSRMLSSGRLGAHRVDTLLVA